MAHGAKIGVAHECATELAGEGNAVAGAGQEEHAADDGDVRMRFDRKRGMERAPEN